MIPFTFSKTVEVLVTEDGIKDVAEAVLGSISDQIRAKEPKSCTNEQSQILFSGGPFSVPNPRWNVLGMITKGKIDVMRSRNKLVISYKLWYTELLILASLATASVAYILIFSLGIRSVWMSAVAWLGFYLVNYIISIARFDGLMHSALNKLDTIVYSASGRD